MTMKVFTSWSDEASKIAAEAFGESVRGIFTGVDPWLSKQSIAPGKRWFALISYEAFATIPGTPSPLDHPSPADSSDAGTLSSTFFPGPGGPSRGG